MSDFLYLIPVALGMGAIGLGVFLWSLRSGQYEDLDGAAARILFDDEMRPLARKGDAPPEADPAATEHLRVAARREPTRSDAPC